VAVTISHSSQSRFSSFLSSRLTLAKTFSDSPACAGWVECSTDRFRKRGSGLLRKLASSLRLSWKRATNSSACEASVDLPDNSPSRRLKAPSRFCSSRCLSFVITQVARSRKTNLATPHWNVTKVMTSQAVPVARTGPRFSPSSAPLHEAELLCGITRIRKLPI
jgi:hypothetical protein